MIALPRQEGRHPLRRPQSDRLRQSASTIWRSCLRPRSALAAHGGCGAIPFRIFLPVFPRKQQLCGPCEMLNLEGSRQPSTSTPK